MADRQLDCSLDKFDGTLGERAVPQYSQPRAGVLIERTASGVTYALFNFSGVTIKSGQNSSLDSIIPCNQFLGPRDGLSSKAAKHAVSEALQELSTQPYFRELINGGALIAFLGGIETDLGLALAEVAPKFMVSLGASPFTQNLIRGIECPSVWECEGTARPTTLLIQEANIRRLLSGER